MGHIRRNGVRVTNDALKVSVGDILTLPLGENVRVIELVSLPDRRGSPAQAIAHYRIVEPQSLDPAGESTLAAGTLPPYEED